MDEGGYPRSHPHGLMFHRFHSSRARPTGQGSITETEFEEILNYVGIERILEPDKWLSKVNEGVLEDQDLCVTFDDGLQSQINVALPVLDRYGLKAFWFVFSSVFEGNVDKNEIYNYFGTSEFENFDTFVDNFLPRLSLPSMIFSEQPYYEYYAKLKNEHPFYTENDLKFRYVRNFILSRDQFEKEMDGMIEQKGKSVFEIGDKIWMKNEDLRRLHSEGHLIGLHSYSHPFAMGNLPEKEQRLQYDKNLQHISSIIKDPIISMAHPLNSYGPETLDILNSLNISCGFRSNMESENLNEISPLLNLQLLREDSTNLIKLVKKYKD